VISLSIMGGIILLHFEISPINFVELVFPPFFIFLECAIWVKEVVVDEGR